jgi:hypothetical protein
LGDRTLKFCFGNKEAAQFHFWEYINGKQIGFSLALHLQCVALSHYNQFVEVFLEPCFKALADVIK